jgi:hypothetical protein
MKCRTLFFAFVAVAVLSAATDVFAQRDRNNDRRGGSNGGGGNNRGNAAAAPATQRVGFDGLYGDVVARNMFLKDRRRPNTGAGATTQASTRPAVTPENSYVLIGVVFEEEDADEAHDPAGHAEGHDGQPPVTRPSTQQTTLAVRAYFEPRGGGRILKLKPGDTIARGTIVEVQLDAVAYQAGDNPPVWVEIGQDLTGASARGTSSFTPAGTTGTGTPTTGPAPNADPSTLSVEERMRLRRQQQMGQ